VIHQCYIPAVESFGVTIGSLAGSLARPDARANTMVSAGHSAIRKQQKLAQVIKECDTSVAYPLLSHFVT
jgi:hypothetical protein